MRRFINTSLLIACLAFTIGMMFTSLFEGRPVLALVWLGLSIYTGVNTFREITS